MAHAFNSSTRETETGGSLWVPGQLELLRPCLKNKTGWARTPEDICGGMLFPLETQARALG